MNTERKIENIPIEKIIPNIYQPRIKFEESKLNELAESLKEYGVIQPIILRNIGNTFEIIDGERRYRAAKKAGFKTIPSIVLNMTEKEAAEILLTENMQKQVLTPIELANSYQQIMLLNKIDIEELSKKIGKDKNYIENKLSLLNLPLEIQEALLNNKISEGHARLLLKVDSKAKKIKLYNKIVKERLTIKMLEEIINESEEKENNEKDEYSLNDLNEEHFLTKQKENNKEEIKMNFNQYNNLLKEQQTQMMEMSQPTPIISNQEENKNQFFPSLEEQPLNMEIPNVEEPAPQFEVPTFNPEPQMQAPAFEMPQAPMTQEPMGMPQFEVPTFNPEPQMQAPAFEMPQAPMMQEPMGMPQFGVPAFNPEPQMQTPAFEMPQAPMMQEPMGMPQFGVPAFNPEPQMQTPAFEMPQAPMMQEPMGMPQFEVPTFNPEPQMQAPAFEMPQEVVEQPPVMVDVMPAVNMIRNLIPLLENSGYKINIEENDNMGEYQVTLKIQK